MKLFYFEGKDLSISMKGYVIGKNDTEALKSIDKDIEIEKFEYIKHINFKKLNLKEHTKLIKMLKAFISSGLNFFDAIIYIRENQEVSQRIKIALDLLINNIKSGIPYKQSMDMNIYFDYEFRKPLSKASDNKELLKMLERLENIYTNRIKNYNDIKNLLTYPIMLFSALISLLLFLQFIISPVFKETFKTEFSFTVSWVLLAITLSLTIAIIIFLKNKSKFDEILYKLPIIGKIYRKYSLLEFVETTMIFVESGDTTYTAFEKTAEILSSKKLKEEIINVLAQLEEGNNIIEIFKKTDLKEMVFSITLSKDLSDLKKPFEILEAELNLEINQAIQKIKKLLEPMLIMIISIIILEVAYGFYGGIFNTINNLGI
ncbi:type IV pilus assembly protein PilC [Marinitoga hydrogenitolerans DSM 16785]|uniref:Type IV pilus assembly protein PilC n=1 Tax=Marinitoga hydrogenitolerans (strain DSM 16785 / JCM 12826 / AT1271) TaxID=1122195 RepID=A0A1M5AF21_MARH1|nr:type II secretion system F family protein [Marinitoga hydrogenitolerans]SHF28833.1 type IV pilus assembly protein PilC [Marinitoga hydrogenitolerans DSM 16785]